MTKEILWGIDELKLELRSLSDIIVGQTLDSMMRYYEEENEEWFQKLLNNVVKYKSWIILNKFLRSVNRSNSPQKINMLSMAEDMLDHNV